MLLKTQLMPTDVRDIAASVNVEAEISSVTERPRRGGRDIRVRFVPDRGEHREKYARVSASAFQGERRVFALCYHGFLDVFRAIYAKDANAVIETAFARWTSLADLEARKSEAYEKQVGAPIYPITFGELCSHDDIRYQD